ncbi:MAG: hypothetical protein O7D29_04405 [Gemmatimonadetes bacterium]|nr:hypothetical protein [Gemmatimonadota bacterium]
MFEAFERLTQKLMAVSKEEMNELEAKRVWRRGGWASSDAWARIEGRKESK